MTLFEPTQRRTALDRYAPGYFQLIRDFALHGAVSGRTDAELSLPLRHQR